MKIEGRMKAPECVAVVTGIYRKYLDLYANHGHYQVNADDLKALNQIFNRGGFRWKHITRRSGLQNNRQSTDAAGERLL